MWEGRNKELEERERERMKECLWERKKLERKR